MKLKFYVFFLLVGFVTSVPMPEEVYDKGVTSSPQIIDGPSYSPQPDYVTPSPKHDYADSSDRPAAYPTTDPTVYAAPPPYEAEDEAHIYPTETRSYNDDDPSIEERAHSVHSTYKKEQPHEFERPLEPVEVEVFDPYSFGASGDESETTDAPYVSEEESYVMQSPSDNKKQTPYPEEEKVEETYPQEAYDKNQSSKTNYDPKEVFDALSSESEVYPAPAQQPSTYISEEIYSSPVEKVDKDSIRSSPFLQAFDQILIESDRYRTSLTPGLRLLVEDASGRRGVVTCKLQRTRIVVTKGVKALLESYPHWVKLGTTIEESHCRQDSKMALVAYSSQLAKVAQDLAGMEDMDLDDILEAPNTSFKRLEQIVLQTLALFGPLADLDDHHSHNTGNHGDYIPH